MLLETGSKAGKRNLCNSSHAENKQCSLSTPPMLQGRVKSKTESAVKLNVLLCGAFSTSVLQTKPLLQESSDAEVFQFVGFTKQNTHTYLLLF